MEYGIILVVECWELEKFKEFMALLVVYVLDYNLCQDLCCKNVDQNRGFGIVVRVMLLMIRRGFLHKNRVENWGFFS